jgi:ketosteroid isomerase-like protein
VAQPVTQQFMDALREAERRRDPEPLLPLFAEDAQASKVSRKTPARGREEIRRFWSDYLQLFERIESEFLTVLTNDLGAALEWRSRGRLRNGRPVDYRGVTLLEVEGLQVRRFRTYYDTAAFVVHGPELATAGG